MTNAEFVARALAHPYVEFVGSQVFHLVIPGKGIACYANAMIPYNLKDGEVCTSFVGGTPFPAFVAAPSPDRRLCRTCARRTATKEAS